MSDTTQYFCLECDVLLMRLFGKPDLASLHDESSPESRGVPNETFACPECGKVFVRQDNGELAETRA